MTILNATLAADRITVVSDTLLVAPNPARTPGGWMTKVHVAPHVGMMVCGIGWSHLPNALSEALDSGWFPSDLADAAAGAATIMEKAAAEKLDEHPFMARLLLDVPSIIYLFGRCAGGEMGGYRFDYAGGPITFSRLDAGTYLHPEVDFRPEPAIQTGLRQQQVFRAELGGIDGAGGSLLEHELTVGAGDLPELRVRCLGRLDRFAEHRGAMGDLSAPLDDAAFIARHGLMELEGVASC